MTSKNRLNDILVEFIPKSIEEQRKPVVDNAVKELSRKKSTSKEWLMVKSKIARKSEKRVDAN